ncbi:MAG: ABC transporter permease [Pseudomonadales bacterium]
MSGAARRLRALIRKETIQIMRDPASLMIAFVLPPMLLFLFAYAVSLDVRGVPFGVVLESDAPQARSLAAAYAATPYLAVRVGRDRRQLETQLVSGHIKGFVVIPSDFTQRLTRTDRAVIQIITDGSQPNTAAFTDAYGRGVFSTWRAGQAGSSRQAPTVELEPRFWFNAELESRRVLLPGAIAIVMTMIGTLLTALVLAREWERGTMEAMMSTPARLLEMLIGKLLPYFLLGLATTVLCTLLTVGVYGVPLRGSALALLGLSACFLLPALGQGMLISTLTRNQFLASQIALLTGFLPAFLLSGFLFEIHSMPAWIQMLTRIVPARYFVEGLQTLFLAGDVGAQLRADALALLLLGAVLFAAIARATHRRLD